MGLDRRKFLLIKLAAAQRARTVIDQHRAAMQAPQQQQQAQQQAQPQAQPQQQNMMNEAQGMVQAPQTEETQEPPAGAPVNGQEAGNGLQNTVPTTGI